MSQNIIPDTPEYKGKEAYLEVELKEMIKMINERLEFRESQLD